MQMYNEVSNTDERCKSSWESENGLTSEWGMSEVEGDVSIAQGDLRLHCRGAWFCVISSKV